MYILQKAHREKYMDCESDVLFRVCMTRKDGLNWIIME